MVYTNLFQEEFYELYIYTTQLLLISPELLEKKKKMSRRPESDYYSYSRSTPYIDTITPSSYSITPSYTRTPYSYTRTPYDDEYYHSGRDHHLYDSVNIEGEHTTFLDNPPTHNTLMQDDPQFQQPRTLHPVQQQYVTQPPLLSQQSEPSVLTQQSERNETNYQHREKEKNKDKQKNTSNTKTKKNKRGVKLLNVLELSRLNTQLMLTNLPQAKYKDIWLNYYQIVTTPLFKLLYDKLQWENEKKEDMLYSLQKDEKFRLQWLLFSKNVKLFIQNYKKKNKNNETSAESEFRKNLFLKVEKLLKSVRI